MAKINNMLKWLENGVGVQLDEDWQNSPLHHCGSGPFFSLGACWAVKADVAPGGRIITSLIVLRVKLAPYLTA